ncbi:MAG: hypothetical protein ABMA02_18170 [Saprospiraceae bacterium]
MIKKDKKRKNGGLPFSDGSSTEAFTTGCMTKKGYQKIRCRKRQSFFYTKSSRIKESKCAHLLFANGYFASV